jgi:hypothetical protein
MEKCAKKVVVEELVVCLCFLWLLLLAACWAAILAWPQHHTNCRSTSTRQWKLKFGTKDDFARFDNVDLSLPCTSYLAWRSSPWLWLRDVKCPWPNHLLSSTLKRKIHYLGSARLTAIFYQLLVFETSIGESIPSIQTGQQSYNIK